MMTVFLVRAVRFIRMRKQIQGRKTAVNGRVISDIRSDLSDQETEGCYAMPYKIYGVYTITSLLITQKERTRRAYRERRWEWEGGALDRRFVR